MVTESSESELSSFDDGGVLGPLPAVDSESAAAGSLPVLPGNSFTISKNALISVLWLWARAIQLVWGRSPVESHAASAPQVADSGSAGSGAVVGLPELVADLWALLQRLDSAPV